MFNMLAFALEYYKPIDLMSVAWYRTIPMVFRILNWIVNITKQVNLHVHLPGLQRWDTFLPMGLSKSGDSHWWWTTLMSTLSQCLSRRNTIHCNGKNYPKQVLHEDRHLGSLSHCMGKFRAIDCWWSDESDAICPVLHPQHKHSL
jgi:hypothetical protein